MSNSIYIEEYSYKSFVVRGDTREYKESLKAMGGKWNSRLTDKNGDKFGAWLFWTDKRKEVNSWFSKGFPDIENSYIKDNGGKRPTTDNFSSGVGRLSTTRIHHLENKVERLSKMLEAICQIQNISMSKIEEKMISTNGKFEEVIDEEYDIVFEEELPNITPKRLLGVRKVV